MTEKKKKNRSPQFMLTFHERRWLRVRFRQEPVPGTGKANRMHQCKAMERHHKNYGAKVRLSSNKLIRPGKNFPGLQEYWWEGEYGREKPSRSWKYQTRKKIPMGQNVPKRRKKMKKIGITLMAVLLTLCMALPTFAAGLTDRENSLLESFTAYVKEFDSVLVADDGTSIANQYIATAQNALTQADLDEEACEELGTAMDDAMAIIRKANAKTKAELKAVLPQVLSVVNATAKKYNMTVSVDGEGYATVLLKLADGSVTVIGSTKAPVKQTGTDFSLTYFAGMFLGALLAVGFALIYFSRKKTSVQVHAN